MARRRGAPTFGIAGHLLLVLMVTLMMGRGICLQQYYGYNSCDNDRTPYDRECTLWHANAVKEAHKVMCSWITTTDAEEHPTCSGGEEKPHQCCYRSPRGTIGDRGAYGTGHQFAHVRPVCGRAVVLNRNVGGEDSVEGEWPWQVSVRKLDKHICGGALITHNWIVTAAHCFIPESDPSQFSIMLGANKLEKSWNHRQTIGVGEIIRNPRYAGEATSGDIALVQLAHPVRFTKYILPICVPAATVEFPPGMMCWVTGWGDISEGQDLPAPKKLQKLQVPIIDIQTCRKLYNIEMGPSLPRKHIQNDMMCAGYAEGLKDTCKGDSGGPLMCKMNQQWLLAGIVSWGEGCAEKNRPGVYIRLTSYQQWIHRIIPDLEFIQVRRGYNMVKNQADGRGQISFSAELLLLAWTLHLALM